MRSARTLLVLFAALLGACRSPRSEAFEAAVSIPRPPAPPGLEPRSSPAEAPPERARPIDGAWVRIDLAAILGLAGAETIEVLRARERLALALALEDAAGSRFLPDLRSGLDFRRHLGQIQATEGEFLDVTRQETAAGVRAELVLRLGEAIFDTRAAARRVEAEHEGVEEQTQNSMLVGALFYLDLIAAVQDVEIAEEALAHSRSLRALAQARFEAGFAVQADVDRAAAQEAADRVQVTEAEADFQAASIELARHLRLDPAVTIYPGERTVVPLPVDLAVPREELVGQALEKNPALRRSTRLVEEASEIEDRAVLSPWIPSLGIGGLWSERGENPGRFGGAEDYFASIGWEIKGFGLGTRAEVRAAEARHRLARLDLAEVRERLIAAIVRLRAELASQKEAIEASEAGITAARSAVEKTRARLEQGQGLVVEMLEAQAALARAQRTRLRAITGFNKSVFIQKTLLGKRPVP